MEQEKGPERGEVYERIPWEMLEKGRNDDRRWLLFGIAGAVVLGALAYSLVGNHSSSPSPDPVSQSPSSTPASVPPAAPPPMAVTPSAPTVTAEADLYAVDPEQVRYEASARAEWFTAEYLTVDNSQQSQDVLTSLLPSDVPLPQAPEGAQVFVEWVKATGVMEIAPLTYQVTVLARTLAATDGGAYVRQPPLSVTVSVSVAGEHPEIVSAPIVESAFLSETAPAGLTTVPSEVEAAASQVAGVSEIIGGIQDQTGAWSVVAMVLGGDGVTRPQTIVLP
jgi:hypothetical protein